MQIFNYDPVLFVLLGDDVADPSPLEKGGFLIPANATEIAPPVVGPNEVAVFDPVAKTWSAKIDYRKQPLYDTTTGEPLQFVTDIFTIPPGATDQPVPALAPKQAAVFGNGAWVVKPDYRGVTLYNTTTKLVEAIAEIGALPSDIGCTDIAPPVTPCTWSGTAWVDDIAGFKANQIADLQAAYAKGIAQPVSFKTAAGVIETFQADPQSVANAQASIAGCMAAQATPSGFYWVAADNTQVPFTYADLLGLAAVMFAQGASAFQHLQAQKALVNAATTSAAIQAVVW
jgi:Domain of unknown function (DUF4376)